MSCPQPAESVPDGTFRTLSERCTAEREYGRLRPLLLLGTLLLWLIVHSGCGMGAPRDPYSTLSNPRASANAQLDALSRLDSPSPSPRYLDELARLTLSPNHLESVRKAAFNRLANADPARLDEVLATTLSRIQPTDFRAWVITRLGELDRKQLTKAIIRSWAMPTAYWLRDRERPEPTALAVMYGGKDKVAVVLLDTLLSANPLVERNLRMRCWELMVGLDQDELLVELVNSGDLVGTDPMLLDMRSAINDLGVLPRNKEEILWIRELRKDDHADYWTKLSESLSRLDASRRQSLAARELPLVVAADRHRSDLLGLDQAALYELLARQIESSGPRYTADFSGWEIKITERLNDVRDQVTWGDLVAMVLAREALQDPAFLDHLFDQADRDMIDSTTEYGGVIRLDPKGRFELVEHPPRSRISDEKYLAPQSLFDDGYTALFHFHNHAQNYTNRRHAGPHMGDLQYADETGANCLVFTFVKPDLLNVDFYRHDSVVVDLGTARRPDQG
ncbi:MAG: hypothetical protein VX641_07710 [Planctomycetota bacterium]|nr:hypothetical protein [Planctomycetota bacterium]